MLARSIAETAWQDDSPTLDFASEGDRRAELEAACQMAEKEQAARTLAEKLERLFQVVHPADRREHTYDEVASALRERGGPTISATYIWQLRKGLRDNPTKKHLEALAGFFGVPPAYFFDDEAADRVDAELNLLATMRDASVRGVALRAAGLSSESLGMVREVIEHARRLEGLPSGEPLPDEQTPDQSDSGQPDGG